MQKTRAITRQGALFPALMTWQTVDRPFFRSSDVSRRIDFLTLFIHLSRPFQREAVKLSRIHFPTREAFFVGLLSTGPGRQRLCVRGRLWIWKQQICTVPRGPCPVNCHPGQGQSRLFLSYLLRKGRQRTERVVRGGGSFVVGYGAEPSSPAMEIGRAHV